MDGERRCRAEITELHLFFQRWLGGAAPPTDEAFARCVDALAPGFVWLSPTGEAHDRDPLIASLRAAHGHRPGLAIWIEALAVRALADGLFLARYEEWQREGEQTTCRLSSAVLVDAPRAPSGLAWAHVHETWKQGHAP